MGVFETVDNRTKEIMVDAWKHMTETEKTHFINQVSLALTIWGTDEAGKKAVVDVLRMLLKDGSKNLCDFGLYIDSLYEMKELDAKLEKIKRAAVIIEGYRAKNALPSEPTKDIGL